MRSGKNDYAEVALYALIMAVLLGWRYFVQNRAADLA
jgi:DMSO/TMAO reductase YedYZ heme-binding membrane subunit